MKYTFVRTASMFLLGSIVALSAASASAGWGLLGGSGGGSSGGSSGYTASYASGGGSSGGAAYASYGSSGGGAASSGGSSGGPGFLQRVATRVHEHIAQKRANHAARRAAYGSSGGSGGSSGYSVAYASSGGGSTGYASSGGSSGGISSYSGGSSGGVSYGSVGATSYGSVGSSYGSAGSGYYGASTATANTVSSVVSNVENDSVYLTVSVPANAKVFVNGNATTSTGSVRQFVSHGLKAGKSYKFDVRAEVEGVDGKLMTEEKTVAVTSGQREQLQFAFAESKSAIETAITLNLPEGAEVSLAGNPTKAVGTQRTFRTSKLKPGQSWDDYEIEVKLGDQVKRQTVRLIAGDELELSFDFSDNQLAAR
ncbi:MAG: TIGR03000 domain-containing protein [Pirellulaceae bacterium]